MGDAVPLIKDAALGGLLVFSGEERQENRLLEGPDVSAGGRTEESPGTVFMGDEDDTEAPDPITDLYGRDGLYML